MIRLEGENNEEALPIWHVQRRWRWRRSHEAETSREKPPAREAASGKRLAEQNPKAVDPLLTLRVDAWLTW